MVNKKKTYSCCSQPIKNGEEFYVHSCCGCHWELVAVKTNVGMKYFLECERCKTRVTDLIITENNMLDCKKNV